MSRAQFSLPLDADEKQLLAKAAASKGMATATFIRSAALDAAHKVVDATRDTTHEERSHG